jgi:hypothetical protein
MGEAKSRKAAKAAGNPWPCDLPKKHPHEGQYLGDDGEWHDYGRAKVGVRGKLVAVVALASLLTGCGAAIPVVVASSYVAGQTAAAYMPDSIEGKAP